MLNPDCGWAPHKQCWYRPPQLDCSLLVSNHGLKQLRESVEQEL